MRRRDILAVLAGAADLSGTGLGQQADRVQPAHRLACLVSGSQQSHGPHVDAFREGLRDAGYVEGRDFTLDLRWAGGRLESLSVLAGELALLKPDLVVTATSAAALAVREAMPGTPIVSVTLGDPIGLGLVASYARPGGNVTGILFSFDTLPGKQLELARELKPGARTIGMLVNMGNPTGCLQRRHAEAVAPALSMRLVSADIRSADDLEAAFKALLRERVEFVLVLSDPITMTERKHIAELALTAGLPTLYGLREFVDAGGFMSYAIHLRENWRRAAYFVDKILKGAKPADLPVEVPTKYELIINLGTASALGLTIPSSLLTRADELIE